MTALDPLAHDEGVKTALATIGRPVDIGDAPDGALDAVLSGTGPGYIVIYPVDGGGRDGTAAHPDEDAVLPYRIHCIDGGWEGAAWLLKRVEEAMAELAVANRHVMRVEPITRGSVTRDREEPRVFTATPLYHLHTAPA